MTESVCALGFFDGVHKAHSAILSECVNYGKKHKLTSIALTFEKSPGEFFGKTTKYLTTNRQKTELMHATGIEKVAILPCKEALFNLSPEAFFHEVLIKKLNAKALFCGFNYTFGKNAKGDIHLLKKLCDENGLQLFITERMSECGTTVSSTEIKAALKKGDVELANRLLTRPFEITGVVETGKRLGRKMSTPTVNIYPDKYFPDLPYGVYATKTIVDNTEYLSVTNIGTNPTVGDKNLRIETYIHNFNKDIYGKTVTVKFFKFLRSETQFASVKELKAQLENDKISSYKHFTEGVQ